MKTGTNVNYCPVLNQDGTAKRTNMLCTVTQGEPFTAADGEEVVFLRDMSGYVSLKHVIEVPPVREPA